MSILDWIFVDPDTPKGRDIRIKRFIKKGYSEDVSKAIVYSKDFSNEADNFTPEESKEADRILKMLEKGQLKLPGDKK